MKFLCVGNNYHSITIPLTVYCQIYYDWTRLAAYSLNHQELLCWNLTHIILCQYNYGRRSVGCWQLVFTLRQKDRLISDHFGKPQEGSAAAAVWYCHYCCCCCCDRCIVAAKATTCPYIIWCQENHTQFAVRQSWMYCLLHYHLCIFENLKTPARLSTILFRYYPRISGHYIICGVPMV